MNLERKGRSRASPQLEDKSICGWSLKSICGRSLLNPLPLENGERCGEFARGKSSYSLFCL